VSAPRTDTLRASLNVSGGKQRVLIVDDNEDARLLLSEILRAIGHDVRTAADGYEAVKLVETFTPDVAILDIGLPGMDGYELATKLGAIAKGAKLIALSGYGQESDRVKSHAAGFDRHLVKPVDIRRLLDSIGELGERG
jgi:DNA-binding response OmpR family regulator